MNKEKLARLLRLNMGFKEFNCMKALMVERSSYSLEDHLRRELSSAFEGGCERVKSDGKYQYSVIIDERRLPDDYVGVVRDFFLARSTDDDPWPEVKSVSIKGWVGYQMIVTIQFKEGGAN